MYYTRIATIKLVRNTVGCNKKLMFRNCDYDCTTKYSRKISRNYNIPEIVIGYSTDDCRVKKGG